MITITPDRPMQSFFGMCSVVEFGATGNGVTDDTLAIQNAINSPSSVIYFPGGTYKFSSEITFGDNKTLWFDKSAFLVRANNSYTSGGCCLRNSNFSTGNTNIHIIGGYFDGNCANNTRSDSSPYMGGVFLRLFKVNNFSFTNGTIKNPLSFSTQFAQCTNGLIQNTLFVQDAWKANQDGIHINGLCSNIWIINSNGYTSDDMVAVNSSATGIFQLSAGACENIQIIGVRGSGVRAVRIISGGGVNVSKVSVSKVSGWWTYGAVKIDDYDLGSGNAYDITVREINCVQTTAVGFATLFLGGNIKNLTASDINSFEESTCADPIVSIASGKTIDNFSLTNVTSRHTSVRNMIDNAGTLKRFSFSNGILDKTSGSQGGSFLNNSGTIDSIKLNNCQGKNLTNLSRNNAGVIRRMSIDSCDADTVTNFFKIEGTAATKTLLKTSGNTLASVTNNFDLNGQPVSLNGLDVPVDRTVLTPDTGDIVNDSTDLLKQWDGGAWV